MEHSDDPDYIMPYTPEGEDEEDNDEDINNQGKEDVVNQGDDTLHQQCVLPLHFQSVLAEIVRCAVCLDIPKPCKDLQIRTCEKGHHFCSFCIRRLKTCAVCRGRFYSGRNFMVEEVINKLGRVFGLVKPLARDLPPSWPAPLPKGHFRCPHNCPKKIPALYMLSHLREKHSHALQDKLRSNPYNGYFQYNFTLEYQPDNRHVCSFQISDMGLMSAIIIFPASDSNSPFKCWVQTLHKDPLFKYRILISNSKNQAAGRNDLPVLDYRKVTEKNPETDIMLPFVPVAGEKLTVLVFVYRGSDAVSEIHPLPPTMLDTNLFQDMRKARRCAARNERRRRVIKKKSEGAAMTTNVTVEKQELGVEARSNPELLLSSNTSGNIVPDVELVFH